MANAQVGTNQLVADSRNAGADQAMVQVALAATARATEIAGGGLALMFAASSQEGQALPAPPLRAAAGFESPEAAREAGEAVFDTLRQVIESREIVTGPAPEALGERAAGGLIGIPLLIEQRVHGALLVTAPAPLAEAAVGGLKQVAGSLALRLDHNLLQAEVAQLRQRVSDLSQNHEDKGDEILKLSEELFAQDIELRRNSEQLGKIERLKNDFIEKMSRELRTPLNGIIEAIISVLAGENEALSDEGRTSLRTALEEGTAFLRTLQNILDLWRIKQGELPVETQDVNVAEVVEEVIFSVQDNLEGLPVVVEKELSSVMPKVRTDLAKLHQILFLLLDNATKFTTSGRIWVRAEVDQGQLRCEIEDTGIGICADDRKLIFDEFYQVDDATSAQYRGAGLGLALVRDLLVLMDGELTLTSEIGQGTCFRFAIPVQVAG